MGLSKRVRNLCLAGLVGILLSACEATPTATPTHNSPDYPTNTPTAVYSPSSTPTLEETVQPSPTFTLEPSPTVTNSPVPTATFSPTPSPSPSPTPTSTPRPPTPTPTNTPNPPTVLEYISQTSRPYSRHVEISGLWGPYWVENDSHLLNYHPGIDIDEPVGSPVFASYDSVVSYVYEYVPGSFNIYLERDLNGLLTFDVYRHVRKPRVEQGDLVSECEVIAESFGDPNFDEYSNKPHIEFDIFLEDPLIPGYDKFNSPITEESWRDILNMMSFCD